MIDSLLRPFYAATISMGADGGLLVASSRERVLAWGIVFCVLASLALIMWLLRIKRRVALSAFAAALLIPVLIMPSVKREYIYVLPDRLTIDTGHWFMPSRSTIDLAQSMHIQQEASEYYIGDLYVEPNATWHISWRDGTREQLRLNAFFTAHRLVVAQYLRDRGKSVHPPLWSRPMLTRTSL